MKTKKIYKTPMCEVVEPATEHLCGLGLHGSPAATDQEGNPIVGAKQGQYLFDDEAEANPEYDL